ncbi:hypothetical protein BKA56DRAFT_117680 [Ilyonectria sp. MPI-CAGE-AT-0026]|nr:hypothetical protein BKA56DRAFT_117680 [Ilyonectria sp. MPI-CAGE-AT-0026]
MDTMTILTVLLDEIISESPSPDTTRRIRDAVAGIIKETETQRIEASTEASHLKDERTRVQQQQQDLDSSLQGLDALNQQVTDLASARSADQETSQDALKGLSSALDKVVVAGADAAANSEALAALVGVPDNESVSMDLRHLKDTVASGLDGLVSKVAQLPTERHLEDTVASRLDGLDSKVAQLPTEQHLERLLSQRLEQILESTDGMLKLTDAKTEFETGRQGVKETTKGLEEAINMRFANLQDESTGRHETIIKELDRLRNRIGDLPSFRNVHEGFEAQAQTLTEAVTNALADKWSELDDSRSQVLQTKLSMEQAANAINATLVSRRDQAIRDLEDTVALKDRELRASATTLAEKESQIRHIRGEASKNESLMENNIRELRDELSKAHEKSEQARLTASTRIQELEERYGTMLNTLTCASDRHSRVQEGQARRIRGLEDQINGVQEECDKALLKRDAVIEERDEALADRDEAIEARDVAIEERDVAIEKRKGAISERDDAIHGQSDAIDERKEAIVERNKALAERKEAIAKCKEAIAERKEAITERDRALAELDGMRNAPVPTPQTQQAPQSPDPRKRHRSQASTGRDVVNNLSRAYFELGELMSELSAVPSPSILLDIRSLAIEIAPMFDRPQSKANMEKFMGNKSSKWHCLRDVCTSGTRALALEMRVCVIPGHEKCILVKSVERLGTRMLDFQYALGI